MRVVFAPDSFKGSVPASEVAGCLRSGWLEVRPGDDLVVLPLADGGEGTLDAVANAVHGASVEHVVVDGPAGPASAPWVLLPDGTAVVELAATCGLPLWPLPDPLGAHTYALGQVMSAAAHDRRVQGMVVALGGSASTDGGAGALAALGAEFLGSDGLFVGLGGAALMRLDRANLARMVAPPAGGVQVLVDVDAPLVGHDGAAAAFGPQKGASPSDVVLLEGALTRFAAVLGASLMTPGSGAAGGTAFGLVSAWGAQLRPGSATIAALVGLEAATAQADLVVTGEGRLDRQSFRGKVVGHVVDTARVAGVDVWACVGQAEPGLMTGLGRVIQLRDVAGSEKSSLARPRAWLRQAGRNMAKAAETKSQERSPNTKVRVP